MFLLNINKIMKFKSLKTFIILLGIQMLFYVSLHVFKVFFICVIYLFNLVFHFPFGSTKTTKKQYLYVKCTAIMFV